MDCYISPKLSKRKLLDFLNLLISENTDPHAIMMHKDGELMLKIGIPPYSTGDKRQLFSLSKSFTSTAIGIAYDKGLLKLNEKMIDIFPDKLPEVISENLAKMTVHDVMTMASGHDSCTLPYISKSEDGIKTFFEREVKHLPGSAFRYNSGATYMLSAIITRRTGMSMLEFLYENFFRALDIVPQMWQTSGGCPINEGGIGLFVSCEDVEKWGLVYLNNGIYNGKRILSEEWVRLAASNWVSTASNGSPNWASGYGYQIWQNAKGGFRADGAFGQFCAVLPKDKIVFSMLAESTNTNKYFEDMIYFASDFEAEGEDDIEIEGKIKKLYAPLSSSVQEHKGYYKLDDNSIGFTHLDLNYKDKNLVLSFVEKEKIQTLTAGNGEWIENSLTGPCLKPTLVNLTPDSRTDTMRFAASYTATKDSITLAVRILNACHSGVWEFSFSGHSVEITISYRTGGIHKNTDLLKGTLI